MNEQDTVSKGTKKITADLIFTDAIQILAERKNISYAEARSELIRSRAFQCMYDFSTELWQEGPVYFLWYHDLLLHPSDKTVYF